MPAQLMPEKTFARVHHSIAMEINPPSFTKR